MDDQSNTKGDLAQLLLWSEKRWVFDGDWEGMKEYGDGNPVWEQLDEGTRHSKGQLSMRKYSTSVLFKLRKDTQNHLPFPAETEWVLLFTDITVAKSYHDRGIDRAMVRMALSGTLSLAQSVRRPFVVIVEPGYAQFKHLFISDSRAFVARCGSMWNHWPVVQSITARQEQLRLDMRFQKLEEPDHNRDLSNLFLRQDWCRVVVASD